MAQGLSDIKTILKSLIVSSPRGMTVDQLNRDYREMEGQNIPYAKLGFSSLENFLKSIPDTLLVQGTGKNAKLLGICSEKSEHINKMVCNQKSVTRDRMFTVAVGRQNESNSSATLKNTHTPRIENNINQNSTVSKPPVFYKNGREQGQQNVSNTSLLNNPPSLFPTPQLQYPYYNSYSPYYYPQYPTSSYYQSSMNYPYSQYYGNNYPMNMYGTQQQHFYNYNNPIMVVEANMNQYLPNKNNAPTNNDNNLSLGNKNEIEPHKSQLSTTNLQSCPNISDKQETTQNITNKEILKNIDNLNETNPFINDIRNDLITKTLSSPMARTNDKPLDEEDLIRQFENMKLYDLRKTDFISNDTKTKSLSSNETDTDKSCISDRNESSSNTSSQNLTNNKIQINIKTTAEDLEEMSMKGNKKNLSEQEQKNINTEMQFNGSLSSSSSSLSLPKPKNLITEKKKKSLKDYENEAVPSIFDDSKIRLLNYPPDVATFKDKIPSSVIPPEIYTAPFFPLFISEIHNPYKFWFHYAADECNPIDNLMQDLESSYSDLEEKELKMPKWNMTPGQICAAMYSSRRLWHRAEILDEPVGEKVKVLFIDYGTVSNIPIKDIKYLLKEFCTLPCQALRGCLACIKPINHRWTRNATLCFLDMVSEKMLYGKLVEMDEKEKVVHMLLVDTNDEKEFQINEALIIKQHARYHGNLDAQNLGKKSSYTARKKHFQEEYPKFEMIEKGKYPSFTEIGHYLSQGIDFEQLQDENVLIDAGDEDVFDFTRKLIYYPKSDDESTNDKEMEENIINRKELLPSSSNNSLQIYPNFNKQTQLYDTEYNEKYYNCWKIYSTEDNSSESTIKTIIPKSKTNFVPSLEEQTNQGFLPIKSTKEILTNKIKLPLEEQQKSQNLPRTTLNMFLDSDNLNISQSPRPPPGFENLKPKQSNRSKIFQNLR